MSWNDNKIETFSVSRMSPIDELRDTLVELVNVQRQLIDANAEIAMLRLCAEGWIDSKVSLPEAGRLIVKRWKNGNVWAGKYSGSAKDTSFDSWRYI